MSNDRAEKKEWEREQTIRKVVLSTRNLIIDEKTWLILLGLGHVSDITGGPVYKYQASYIATSVSVKSSLWCAAHM